MTNSIFLCPFTFTSQATGNVSLYAPSKEQNRCVLSSLFTKECLCLNSKK